MDATTDDALVIIEEEAEAVARCFGVSDTARMAEMMTERIVARLGGQLVYVGKRNREALAIRNAEICREFTGNNIEEIAKKHDLDIRHVRRVLKTCPMPEPLTA
jgi:Mor family transcriptional regulator